MLRFAYAKRFDEPEKLGSVVEECSKIMSVERLRIEYFEENPKGERRPEGTCVHARGFLVPADSGSYGLSDEIMGYEVEKSTDGERLLRVFRPAAGRKGSS